MLPPSVAAKSLVQLAAVLTLASSRTESRVTAKAVSLSPPSSSAQDATPNVTRLPCDVSRCTTMQPTEASQLRQPGNNANVVIFWGTGVVCFRITKLVADVAWCGRHGSTCEIMRPSPSKPRYTPAIPSNCRNSAVDLQMLQECSTVRRLLFCRRQLSHISTPANGKQRDRLSMNKQMQSQLRA